MKLYIARVWVGSKAVEKPRGDLTQRALRRRAEFAEKSADDFTEMKGLRGERGRVYLFRRAVGIQGSWLNF